MAVKEAEENDIMDDDDADADSTCSGATDRKSKPLTESSAGKPQHKCSRKPTVSSVLFVSFLHTMYAL